LSKEPDPVAEQHRPKVQVDLVNQTAFEELPSDITFAQSHQPSKRKAP
jgi:hypothetical protein